MAATAVDAKPIENGAPRSRTGRDRGRAPATCRTWPPGSPARGGKGFSYEKPDGTVIGLYRPGGAPASPRSRSRLHGPTCGSARRRTATSWPPAATHAAASSTATTRAGGRSDADKFGQLAEFGEILPDVRKAVEARLRRRGLPREKVLKLVVKLPDETLIRIGNESYATENESYGLTTLKPDHVEVVGDVAPVRLHRQERPRARRVPRGQAARPHRAPVPRARRQDLRLPGQRGGRRRHLERREGLPALAGPDVTAKTFRTWGGTTIAAALLALDRPPDSERQAEQAVLAAPTSPPRCWGTPERCAAPATCTPWCRRATARASCPRCGSAPGRRRARPASAPFSSC